MKGITMKNVIVVIGSGQIGQAIARRVGIGKHILLADLRLDNANAAAEVLKNAGYEVSVAPGCNPVRSAWISSGRCKRLARCAWIWTRP